MKAYWVASGLLTHLDAVKVRTVSPPSPPPAPPPAPAANVVEITVPSVDSHAAKIADWTARLTAATPEIVDEIFTVEIEPYRESGNMSATEYNALIATSEQVEKDAGQ